VIYGRPGLPAGKYARSDVPESTDLVYIKLLVVGYRVEYGICRNRVDGGYLYSLPW